MKRVVGIAVIAVFACALFLVPISAARVGIFCSVPEEGDYRSRFTYTINITNPGGACSGEVSLIVGSDYYNPNIKNEWSLREMETSCKINDNLVTIPANGYCLINKSVCFITDPKLYQEDFRDWAENPESSFWDKAWYKCCFIKTWPPFPPEPPVCEEGDIGKPILTKMITEFYSSSVKYNEIGCPDKLLFDYEVELWQNENKTIELQVRNYSSSAPSEWETKATQYCPKGERTLKFPNVTLSRDNLNPKKEGQYRFKGWSTSDPYPGPSISEEFYEPDVKPREGTNNDTFTYSVEVNASICDKIELQVYNYTIGEYCDSKGTRNYTTPNSPKTLKWININLSSHELNRFNDSKFKFVSILCGKESPEKELPIWPFYLNWSNATVKPERGFYYSKYNYCIDVNSSKELGVRLTVYYPSGEKAMESELKMYNKSDAYTWKGICFDTKPFAKECEGSAAYKFKFLYKGNKINDTEEYEGKRYAGPDIGVAEFENNSVEPVIGTRETKFTYSIGVNATKIGWVCPSYQCPHAPDWNPIPRQEYISPGSPFTFIFRNVTLSCDDIGMAKYMFEFDHASGKTPSDKYDDPELIEEKFSKLLVNPDNGTNTTWFNFNANLCSSEEGNINVTLQVSPDESAGEEDWINVTDNSYENVRPREIIPINFNVSIDTNLSSPQKEGLTSEWKKNKLIYWRVKGRFTNSTINSTKYHINLTWSNSSFSPPKVGWWNDSFTASVNLSANVNGTVELKVKCKNWRSVGNTTILNPLSWKNESICPESYEGNTSYQFIFHCGDADYPNEEQDGPEVFIPINISFTEDFAEPDYGVYYNFKDDIFNGTSSTLFNFSINVTADKPTTLKLVLTDPCGEKHNMTEECKYTTPHQPQECSWRMIELPSGQAGKWNYTFLYYDTRLYYDTGDGWKMSNKTFKGPEIIAVFENYTLDPESCPFGDLCNVTVCMRGTEEMNVTLEAFNLWPGYKNWTIIEPLKQYEPPGEECLNWTIDTFKVPFDKLRLIWKVI